MAGRKAFTFIGLPAAGVGAYYLYNAGGSPKVAEKQFEADAAQLSSKVRSELPGKEKEAKTSAKLYAQEAGEKVDKAADDAKAATNKVDAKLESYRASAEKKLDESRRETGAKLTSAVDTFDKTVEKKASETKGWLGGWFGGK
ncbi:uncharacterized protein BDZ99DRAFT_474553 [Mytilinidion resinicola]|uniref:Calcofluor white hypersensitive protein n=1 Tax=Mytilinidion resinicola TaxID=574789 RepID=A0A6A6YTW7_9PEZI|nr:uncharacterized protein BDZ99DRAFT_474553 [Mytilinidion resinicola]KAF2812372.1 hypothetical protein BDZ99DRAFT_474553 [Mytilinidion resinicola]